MTTEQPSFWDRRSSGYLRQLEHALDEHLDIVRHWSQAGTMETPWEFDAALVTIRWIADELRRVKCEDPPVPF